MSTFRKNDQKKDAPDRISQKDVRDSGRYVRDRHSRLAEQNEKLEKEAKRAHFLMIVTFVVAMALMGLPTSKGVKKLIGEASAAAASSSAETPEEETASGSSAVLTASAAPADTAGADESLSAVSGTSGSSPSGDDSTGGLIKASSADGTDTADSAGATEGSTDSSAADSSTASSAASDSGSAAASDSTAGEDITPSDTGDSTVMLDTVMGPMLYYSQDDPEWANYLWGGTDAIAHYGCGPTTVAMVVNSFGNSAEKITPVTVADWAYQNGYFAQGSGAYNGLILNGIPAFSDLKVESMQNDTSGDAIRNALHEGSMMIALVGPGYFTPDGHFILIDNINDDDSVDVADVNSLQRTQNSYTAEFISGQLQSASTDDGGPLWKISRADS